MTIGLTHRCQCSCVHCSSNVPDRKERNDLEASQVKSFIDQARKLGVVRITFFGGEPLLHKDIVELVRYAHRAGMLTRINTNGWLLDRKLVSELKVAGLNLCDVSIDDPDPETHDRLRGLPGLYERAIEGIGILKEFNILCQIVTYASKENVTSGLKRIIDLGRRLGVFAVSIVFPISTGCWDYKPGVLLSESEKQRVRALGDSHFVHVEIPTHQSRCNVMKASSLYVSPEGDVTPCPFIPYAIGNINDLDLQEIWQRLRNRLRVTKVVLGDCAMNDMQFRRTFGDWRESKCS